MAAGQGGPATHTASREIRRLSWLLDESIRLPGGYRVGLDGIVGLIPGLGDAFGLVASSYILMRARHFGVPRVVMTRMIGNVALEAVIGAIPILGDLFDFVFKANSRNMALMEQFLVDERRTQRSSWGKVILAAVVAFALIVLALFVVFLLVQWIWNLAAV